MKSLAPIIILIIVVAGILAQKKLIRLEQIKSDTRLSRTGAGMAPPTAQPTPALVQPTAAKAQPTEPAVAAEAEEDPGQVKKLSQNESVNNQLSADAMRQPGWFLARGWRARKKNEFHGEGEVIRSEGPMIIYRSNPEIAGNDPEEYQVIYRPSRQTAAVLLGRIAIKLKDMSKAEQIAKAYDMTIEFRKDDIKYIFTRPADRNSVIALTEKLNQDKENIVSAELELANHNLGHK